MNLPSLDAYGVPWLAIFSLSFGVMTFTVFRRTRFGLLVLAVGSNEVAARNLVPGIQLCRIATFVISGFFAGLGGAFLTARLGAARPTAGSGYELDAIAAAIIGGAALTGGRVSVSGALAATLLFSTMRNSLALLNVSSALQQVLIGIVLVAVVSIQTSGARNLPRR